MRSRGPSETAAPTTPGADAELVGDGPGHPYILGQVGRDGRKHGLGVRVAAQLGDEGAGPAARRDGLEQRGPVEVRGVADPEDVSGELCVGGEEQVVDQLDGQS
ncbi:hypothetical protein LP422_02750 [Janibacter limosus]|uniref:Uncharacterized protein n=1 Tax=Janibacter limosus TaxID=53458 RepID=A0AC61U5A0_9MICO|nr:hypothetical protein [Janibacter limosus]UUZ45202.1 hypothetical protein LP422_02750 [Janibacter limosus]